LKDAGIKLRQHPLSGVPALSPIEMRLHDALKLAGIGFTTHRSYVKGYVTDITINQAPIIIEADGIQHTWDDNPERDALRDATHKTLGFRTFRFTGSEILTDAIACIQRVIDECGLVPDTEPVYDIRVNVRGSEHPQWVDDRQEYACDTCGKRFIRRKAYRAKWRTIFCSDECYQQSKRGKKLTDEHKQAVSAAGVGRTVAAGTRNKISVSLTGRPHSPERKAAIAAGRQKGKKPVRTKPGKPLTVEHRANLSASLTGKPHKKPEPIWCDICQRGWSPSNWSRHVRKYHEGGNWNS